GGKAAPDAKAAPAALARSAIATALAALREKAERKWRSIGRDLSAAHDARAIDHMRIHAYSLFTAPVLIQDKGGDEETCNGRAGARVRGRVAIFHAALGADARAHPPRDLPAGQDGVRDRCRDR